MARSIGVVIISGVSLGSMVIDGWIDWCNDHFGSEPGEHGWGVGLAALGEEKGLSLQSGGVLFGKKLLAAVWRLLA